MHDNKELEKQIEDFNKRRRTIIEVVITLAISLVLTGVSLFIFIYALKGDLMARAINGLTLPFAATLFVGWAIIIYNQGLLSIVSHGFSSFFKGLFGRPRKKYFDYITERKKVDKSIAITLIIYSFMLLITILILLYIYRK